MARAWLLCCVVIVTVFSICGEVECIGANWGTVSRRALPPATVAQLLKDNGINKVKLFKVEKHVLDALAGSGLEVMIGMGNGELADMGDYAKAQAWVKENVTAYNPTSPNGVNITMVGVGNEPFLKDFKDMYVNVTFPALQNIQRALDEANLSHIKATIPFNGDVYYSPSDNPVPSAGKFRPDIREEVVKVIEFLAKSKTPFMVNIYPFLSLYYAKGGFPFEYAFFDGNTNPLIDGKVEYTNVYDANLDTLVSALKAEGFGDLPIVVGEMGWPTDGDSNANATLAARFYDGLFKKLAAGKGSPLRPGNTELYMFALLDEDEKSILPGNFERHWGLFRYDGQPKFQVDMSGGQGAKKFLVGAKDVKYLEEKWCTIKEGAKNKSAIDAAISYACDRTDCTAFEDGGSCGGLDDGGKASYAFNGFFQNSNQAPESCTFDGLAEVTTKNISQGNCLFSIQIIAEVPSSSPEASPGGSLLQAPLRTSEDDSGTTGSSPGNKDSGSPPGKSQQKSVALVAAMVVAGIFLS